MINLFKTKKRAALCIALALVLVASVVVPVWLLMRDEDKPDAAKAGKDLGTYTVSFVTNGGEKIEPIKVDKGAVLAQSELPVPSKRGEMFLTWNTDEGLTRPYWDAPIEKDTTLYASYVQTEDDKKVNELVQSVIPYADTDFSVTVCATTELTEENLESHVSLSVNYGKHPDGEEIKLTATAEGEGIYRISGNYAPGGEYLMALVSAAVTFNPEDTVLMAFGLTDKLRTLRFRIVGDSYMEGRLSDKVADIPTEDVVVEDGDSITVTGDTPTLIGATEEENGVICVGEGKDVSDYYKVVKVEATTAQGTTYSVRPAETDEVYDSVSGYQWEDLDGDDYVINEQVKAQVEKDIANNKELSNYAKYLALAATNTPTYQTMSVKEFGEVVPMPVNNEVVTPSGITLGLNFNARNDNFNDIIGKDKRNKFVKMTLGIAYQHKITKLGSRGTISAVIELKVDFWIYFGMGGQFELGWFSYDIDYGASVMTQTEVTFSISLMTSDAKKAVNVNDEIQAIYKSAKDPTPENLLEQYNDLMSASSKPVELFNQDIFEVPVLSMLGGAVKISVPIRFVVTLDMEATFTSYITVLTGNAFGIEGNEDTGLDAYHVSIPERYIYRLELRGKVELKLGLEAGIQLRLGFGLATVSMNVQSGFYGELHGYFFYEEENMNWRTDKATNKGGAYYFEFGIYLDVKLRAQVCRIKYNGNLWDKKWPLYSAGQKEIVYGFVKPTGDEMVLERGVSYIDGSNLLDVYVLDITEERSESNPRIVKNYPFDESKFSVSFNSDRFGLRFESLDKKGRGLNFYIYCRPSGGSVYETTMTIHYKGVQLAFRDTLTKYVTVRYSLTPNANFDKVNTFCDVDFTIDGQVIFTRKVLYGNLITDQPNILYQERSDGKIVSDLSPHEEAALRSAGYNYVTWKIQDRTALFVTEDMSIEAVHNKKEPAKRKCTVTIVDGDNVQTAQYTHGETIKLPYPENTVPSTLRYAYVFSGWIDESGNLHPAADYTVTDDVTLSAQYKGAVRKYLVTFDANGGMIGNSSTFTTLVPYGTTPKAPFTPERAAHANAAYVFDGWSPQLYPVSGEVVYKARWKELKKHTVTFDAGRGQFDEEGKRIITVTVEDGKALTADDIPTAPYLKAEGGYYEFDAWSEPVAAGTVINGDVTYTAGYKDVFIAKTGIVVSDGVNSEDIAVFLDGKNKVKGYTYTLNTQYYGNCLEITGTGLTVSGRAEDINITVVDNTVTLHDLTLTQNDRVEAIHVRGKSTLNISGTVTLNSKTDAEGIRGDYSEATTADITLKGVNGKLVVNAQAYGIAVYGALSVKALDIQLNMPSAFYEDSETGIVYGAVALQVHNHPRGALTVTDSDIVVNGGVVNAAWLVMTNSNLSFTAKRFVPGYSTGLDIMNYNTITGPEPLIVLNNSHISFAHDIAIAFSVSFENDTLYMVNTTLDRHEILSTYPSLEALRADIKAHGYEGMIKMDGNSTIT